MSFNAFHGGQDDISRVEADSVEECAYQSANGHCNSEHLPHSKFCKHHACPNCELQKSSKSKDCNKNKSKANSHIYFE